jgi:hypothetical protein
MIVFNLNTLHLWGRVLTKFQEDRTITYADDGYINTKLNVVLLILDELKRVLKQDIGLDLNVSRTSVLPRGTTQEDVCDVVHNIINHRPVLTHLYVTVCGLAWCLYPGAAGFVVA